MNTPNLLVIMSDQHNVGLMGHAGEPLVRTPNLDRLAAHGVSFRQAYCPAPLCVPSRMAFLTSRYPYDIEVWTNSDTLASDTPTFAHALSLAGWETTLCGRMHFNGPDQHHGFERRLVGDVSGAMRGLPSGLFEGVWNPAGCGQSHSALGKNAMGTGRATYAAYDEDVTARACAFLRGEGGPASGRPFCLVVGLLLPHNPLVCPKALFEEYMDRLPPPAQVGGLPEGEHPAVLNLRRFRGTDRITAEDARRARAAYFGLVTLMDGNIGRILDAMDQSGRGGDTAVLYTSDHGDLAGEHGLWWKDSFYEGSVGVPMIWSWPGRFPGTRQLDAVTSLLDVGPTLLDLAGAEPLPGARGRSLLPFLEGDRAPTQWPDTTFAETCATGQRPARMIRSGRWKLNLYHGYDDPQLFDMVADPKEERDLGRDPAYAEVRRELAGLLLRDWSPVWVERRLGQEALGRKMTKQWSARVVPRESEVWVMREGLNVSDPDCGIGARGL